MTARDDAIEAIARALHADNCPDDVDRGEPCGCADWDREAEVAYEAVEPVIREQILQAVARRIEGPAVNRLQRMADRHRHRRITARFSEPGVTSAEALRAIEAPYRVAWEQVAARSVQAFQAAVVEMDRTIADLTPLNWGPGARRPRQGDRRLMKGDDS